MDPATPVLLASRGGGESNRISRRDPEKRSVRGKEQPSKAYTQFEDSTDAEMMKWVKEMVAPQSQSKTNHVRAVIRNPHVAQALVVRGQRKGDWIGRGLGLQIWEPPPHFVPHFLQTPSKQALSVATNAGRHKAGWSDSPHFGIRAATGKNAENADLLGSHTKNRFKRGLRKASQCGKCGRQNAENAENADDCLRMTGLRCGPHCLAISHESNSSFSAL